MRNLNEVKQLRKEHHENLLKFTGRSWRKLLVRKRLSRFTNISAKLRLSLVDAIKASTNNVVPIIIIATCYNKFIILCLCYIYAHTRICKLCPCLIILHLSLYRYYIQSYHPLAHKVAVAHTLFHWAEKIRLKLLGGY